MNTLCVGRERKENRECYIALGKISSVSSNGSEECDCKILNKSTNGFSLATDFNINEGDLVFIECEGDRCLYKVKWKNKTNDMNLGLYHYGVESVVRFLL